MPLTASTTQRARAREKASRERSSCANCRFYKEGDNSPQQIGNVGLCLFMLPRSADTNDRAKQVPFWAENHASQVIDWQGEGCGTFERKKGK